MRAHLYRPIQNNEGDIRSGAVVSVYEPGTKTLTQTPLYANASGSAMLQNPFVATNGVVDLYTDLPTRFRLGIKVGAEAEYLINDIDATSPVTTSTQRFDLQGNVDLEPGLGDFRYTAVPFARRALVWRFAIESNGTTSWACRVRSGPDDTYPLLFEAVGIGSTDYQCSWPWMYYSDIPESGFIYIGVDDINRGAGTTFTLTQLSGEVFLP